MVEGQQLQLQILSQLGEIGQQIGTLQAQSAHIIGEQAAGAESRRKMYDKLSSLEVVASTVNRIEPLVDAHERKYQRGVGIAWLINAVWTLAAGGAGALMAWILARLSGGAPPHP